MDLGEEFNINPSECRLYFQSIQHFGYTPNNSYYRNIMNEVYMQFNTSTSDNKNDD